MEQQQEQAAPAPTEAPAQIDDATIVAELSRLSDDGTLEGEEAPQEATEAEEAPTEPEQPTEEEGATDEVEPEAVAEEATEPEEAQPAEDPELTKRLEAISRQEQRAKEQVQAARAELENARKEFESKQQAWTEKLDAYSAAAERAQYDPVAVLKSLNVPEDMFEDIARAVYEASPSADPKVRGRARQSMAAREAIEEAKKAREEAKRAQEQFDQYRQQQQQAEQVSRYMGEVHNSVSESHRLVSNLVAADRAEADARLRTVASQLIEQTGETPDPSDVVGELEKMLVKEQARLAKIYGLSPASGSKGVTKTETPAKAPETQAAKTISSDLGTATQPRTDPQTEEELDAELIRAIRAGQVE